MDTLPTLSNSDQITIMTLVKEGMTIDEALEKAKTMVAASDTSKAAKTAPSVGGGVGGGGARTRRRRFMTKKESALVALKRRSDLRVKGIEPTSPLSPNENLEQVHRMVQQGEISAFDAAKQAENIAATPGQKQGDAQRILLMNMVKAGKLSVHDAMAQVKALGMESTNVLEGRIFNFGVHKLSRMGKALRRILQVDYQNFSICIVNNGKRSEQHTFDSVMHIESEDGVGFTISFAEGDSQNKVNTSFEADSLEEKNQIYRILSHVVKSNRSGKKHSLPGSLSEHKANTVIIKEGRIEKKGSSGIVMYNWQTRWLRVYAGELSYYNEGDLDNPINIVSIGRGVASVSKTGPDGITIQTKQQKFSFRIPASGLSGGSAIHIQNERDAWYRALIQASGIPTAVNISRRSARLSNVQDVAIIMESVLKDVVDLQKLVQTPDAVAKVTLIESGLQKLMSALSVTPAKYKAPSMSALAEPADVDYANEEYGNDSVYAEVSDALLPEATPILSEEQIKQRERRQEIKNAQNTVEDCESEVNRLQMILKLIDQVKVGEENLSKAKLEHEKTLEFLKNVEDENSGMDHDANQDKWLSLADQISDCNSSLDQFRNELAKGEATVASSKKKLDRESVQIGEDVRASQYIESSGLQNAIVDMEQANTKLRSNITAEESRVNDLKESQQKLEQDPSWCASVMTARNEVEDAFNMVSRLEAELKQLRYELDAHAGAAHMDHAITEAIERRDELLSYLDDAKSALENPTGSQQDKEFKIGEAEAALDEAKSRHEEFESDETNDAVEQAIKNLRQANRRFEVVQNPQNSIIEIEKEIECENIKIEKLQKSRGLLSEIDPDKIQQELSSKEKALESAKSELERLVPSGKGADESTIETLIAPMSPPISPPTLSGGDPPPPPPLWDGTGVPPPPPMGGMQLSGLPPRAPITPSVKMRAFHWHPVSHDKIKNSFWNNHISEGDKAISVDILERQFEAAATKAVVARKPEQMKTLLDVKRGQNLGIFKSQFKMSMDDLAKRLLVLPLGNDSLPYDTIQSLLKFGPTSIEIEAYSRYKGDKSSLSDVDRFLMELMDIPNLRAKLELLLLLHELPAHFDDLQPSIETCLSAVNALLNSKRLEQVLMYGLSIGNHVNGGTKKGGQHGVLMKSFPKLADTRGSDKETTLMDFLYNELRRRRRTDGDLIKFTDDLKDVCQATETSIKALTAEVDMLAKDLLLIETKSKKLRLSVESEDDNVTDVSKFFGGVSRFVNDFESELLSLGSKAETIADGYNEVLKKFGEPQSTDSEDFFGHVVAFVTKFIAATMKHKKGKPSKPKMKAPPGGPQFRLPQPKPRN